MANHLYYGDHLDMLREHITDESIDLKDMQETAYSLRCAPAFRGA